MRGRPPSGSYASVNCAARLEAGPPECMECRGRRSPTDTDSRTHHPLAGRKSWAETVHRCDTQDTEPGIDQRSVLTKLNRQRRLSRRSVLSAKRYNCRHLHDTGLVPQTCEGVNSRLGLRWVSTPAQITRSGGGLGLGGGGGLQGCRRGSRARSNGRPGFAPGAVGATGSRGSTGAADS